MCDANGIDDGTDSIYNGNGKREDSTWSKPGFPDEQVFILKIMTDWSDKQCKLSIWYNGSKLNPDIEDYTMLLPELDEEYIWYPCVTPFNDEAWCRMRYAQ